VDTTTTSPCWSARHCVSTCRGRSRYRSTKHSPRPNAATASRTADSYISVIWPASCTTFSPRPPPPNAALIATGRPCLAANASTSSAPLTGPSVPGASGAPTAVAIRRAATLSPSASIAAGGGPIQVSPASITARAKPAFSARKP